MNERSPFSQSRCYLNIALAARIDKSCTVTVFLIRSNRSVEMGSAGVIRLCKSLRFYDPNLQIVSTYFQQVARTELALFKSLIGEIIKTN